MRKFLRRLFVMASVVMVAAAAALVTLSELGADLADAVQPGSSSLPSNQPAVKSPAASTPPSAPPRNRPTPTPSPAPRSVDFEVTAPAGFGVNYSLDSRQYRATVDGTGHWKGAIDKLPDGYFVVVLTVTPTKLTTAPYRASCEISYGGKIYVHNESDAQQAIASNVQCIKY